MNKRGKYPIEIGERKLTLTLDLHVAALFEKTFKERFGVKVTVLKWLSDSQEWETEQFALFLYLALKPEWPDLTEDRVKDEFGIAEINEISFRVGQILESAASEELKKKRDQIQQQTIAALTKNMVEKRITPKDLQI